MPRCAPPHTFGAGEEPCQGGRQPCVIWLNHDGLMDADVARIVVKKKKRKLKANKPFRGLWKVKF